MQIQLWFKLLRSGQGLKASVAEHTQHGGFCQIFRQHLEGRARHVRVYEPLCQTPNSRWFLLFLLFVPRSPFSLILTEVLCKAPVL
ncbi:Ras-Related Protein Rab-40A-Like [Manis pentadactyla]|nr:Ras-Related Protein Rab-40A-Like [Manis pentadactyla]